jgi:hypothetical protein
LGRPAGLPDWPRWKGIVQIPVVSNKTRRNFTTQHVVQRFWDVLPVVAALGEMGENLNSDYHIEREEFFFFLSQL